jgi:ribosomal protein S18 acetylase RimI-like enzyme
MVGGLDAERRRRLVGAMGTIQGTHVEPWARGLGIGGRMVDECLRFARRSGYRRITLFTCDALADARRIYERAGFTLDSEHPERSRRRPPELVARPLNHAPEGAAAPGPSPAGPARSRRT